MMGEGAGRRLGADALLGHDHELAAARHAARRQHGEPEGTEDERELIDLAQVARHVERRHDAVTHDRTLEDSSVGAEHHLTGSPSARHELSVVDSVLELAVVTGRPKPASEPAEHRIAEEPRRSARTRGEHAVSVRHRLATSTPTGW